MKTASKIAKECGIDVDYIYHIIKKEKIIRENFLINKYQEDHIHQILYFEGKISEITIESKINVCTKKD
tara:strand:+ start:305 stop:511 length:207 start_codon:yes stop_codon:yes gene_type:complete